MFNQSISIIATEIMHENTEKWMIVKWKKEMATFVGKVLFADMNIATRSVLLVLVAATFAVDVVVAEEMARAIF